MTEIRWTTERLASLLDARHVGDVIEHEIATPNKLRFDAYAVRRSWANDCTIGYEIKVTRSDFMQDMKWHNYLDWCEEFFFVVPPGIVDPREIGDQAGLLIAASTGSKLFVKKRAPRRQISPAKMAEMFRAILITRHGVGLLREGQDRESRAEYWRQWLAGQQDLGEIGHRVSKSLKARIDEEISKVRRENQRIESENECLGYVRKALDEAGIKWDGNSWGIKSRLQFALGNQKSDRVRRIIKNMERDLVELRKIHDEQGT